MPVTLQNAQGQTAAFEPEQVADAIRGGQWSAPVGTPIPIVSPVGEITSVPIEHLFDTLSQGASVAHQEDLDAEIHRQKYGNLADQAVAAVVGGASGLSLGISDQAIAALASRKTKATIREQIKENPWSHGIVKGVGMIAPAFVPGGAEVEAAEAARAVKGGAELATGAAELGAPGAAAARKILQAGAPQLGAAGSSATRAAAQAAETAETAQALGAAAPAANPGTLGGLGSAARTTMNLAALPQHAVTALGNKVEQAILSGLSPEAGAEVAGVAARLGAKAAALAGRSATEGMIYSGSDYLSEQALSANPDYDGQKMAASIGMGGLLGGLGGGLLGAGGVLGQEALGKAAPFLKRLANDSNAGWFLEGRNSATAKKMMELFTERSPTIKTAREAAGEFASREGLAAAGDSAVDILPKAEKLTEDTGAAVGEFRKRWGAMELEGPTVGETLDNIDAHIKTLDPDMHRGAIEELEGVKRYILREAAPAIEARTETEAAQAVEASSLVEKARKAEGDAQGAAEKASRSAKTLESTEGEATVRAQKAAADLEAARVTAASRRADAEVFSGPQTAKESRAFLATDEGKAKLQEWASANPEKFAAGVKGNKSGIPEGFFTKVDPKAARKAARAVEVSEWAEARATATAEKTRKALEDVRATRAAAITEANDRVTAAERLTAERKAAEAKVEAVDLAQGKAVKETPLTFEQIGKIRGTLDDKIRGWNRNQFGDGDLKGEALKKARWVLEDTLTAAADKGFQKIGTPSEVAAYNAAKLRYRKALVIEEGVTKAAASQLKNRKGSLTDYITGGALGHMVGGGLGGVAGGLVMGAVHKVVRERGSATTAVLLDKLASFAAIDRATSAVDARITKGVESIVSPSAVRRASTKRAVRYAASSLAGGPEPHGLDTFEEKRDAVLAAAKDLQAHGSAVGASVTSLGQHAPGTAAGYQSAATRAVVYLAATLPKSRPSNEATPLVDPIEPSDHDKREWSRSVDAVHDPVGTILTGIKDGDVSPAAAQAVANVYPPLAAQMGKATMAAFSKATKPVPYKSQIGVWTAFGAPVPEAIKEVAAYQRTQVPAPPPPNLGTPAKKGRSESSRATMHLASNTTLESKNL